MHAVSADLNGGSKMSDEEMTQTKKIEFKNKNLLSKIKLLRTLK